MRSDLLEDVMSTNTSTTGKERRLRIKALKEREKRMIDLTLIKSCNLLELPVKGNRIEKKEQNTIRFYFENLNGIRSGLWGIDKGRFLIYLWRK